MRNYDVGNATEWSATTGVKLLTGDFNGDAKTDIAIVRQKLGWRLRPVPHRSYGNK